MNRRTRQYAHLRPLIRTAGDYLSILFLVTGISGCTLNEPPYEYLPDGTFSYKTGPIPVMESVSDPNTYKGYVQMKVKFKADEYTASNKFDQGGSVFVSFWVDSSGHVVKVKVVPESSSAPKALYKPAEQIIYDAGPFKPFPEDIKSSTLQFNLIINFKVSDPDQ